MQIKKRQIKGNPYIWILFLIFLLGATSAAMSKTVNSGKLETVVIDPGHGGKDPGAIVGKAHEKDITLSIALKLGHLISKNFPDVKIVYTRKTDVFIPLFERSVIANKCNADLFISIHANYCPSPSIKGTETYVLGLHRTEDNLNVAKKENSVILLEKDHSTRYEGFDPTLSESYIIFELIQNTYINQSVLFAGILQDSFRQHAQRADRDVRQAGFLVLRETAMPSVLIETGYLSNPSEANFLMTDEGRESIAKSIFTSFGNYKSKFDAKLNIGYGETTIPARESINSDSSARKKKSQIVTPTEKLQHETSQRTKTENKNRENNEKGVTFAVQVAASVKKLPMNSKRFAGLEKVFELKVGIYYKYYCSRTNSSVQVKADFVKIKKNVKDAFLVGIRDGVPIPFAEALKDNQ